MYTITQKRYLKHAHAHHSGSTLFVQNLTHIIHFQIDHYIYKIRMYYDIIYY